MGNIEERITTTCVLSVILRTDDKQLRQKRCDVNDYLSEKCKEKKSLERAVLRCSSK